jgi:energy-coupling factor transporter ATP-binding protein EcfA2/CRP-like cAMP-binding protein
METQEPPPPIQAQSGLAEGYHVDFALHSLGWKAFQDLCAQVMEEELKCTVSVYREAQDGGQDAVFLVKSSDGSASVGTVQCKFSGKREQRLRASDITGELEHVEQLVTKGMASVYYFITSMGVDADVARQIRERLAARGVAEPHVEGREWLLGKIKGSPRLRALVPRVYGLGDLSTIIDERCASQTIALLGAHRKAFNVYVPTTPHRSAVNILAKHKLVLLLGAPATGKSTLAAILATMAVDKNEVQVFKCEGPIELRQHWNPNENKRLFWVDDAFGSNLLMPDYVNAWIEFMPKLKTALDHGCHFILTSRTHIWNDAKPRIGSRNHPLLANDTAVVNVGKLAHSEREQILYNHLKAGTQSPSWKAKIKKHLPLLSKEARLIPELARRLGDPTFTGHIKTLPDDLRRFISHPQKFLVQTFEELSAEQRAALTLVFLSQSRLPVHLLPDDDATLVSTSYGVTKANMTQSLLQLSGSLVVRRRDGDNEYWAFWHPTFADAISEILSKRPDLIDVYVRGARLHTLLTEVVCQGAAHVPDAVVVPLSSGEALIERLLETPDEATVNENLFEFLNRRLPRDLVQKVLERAPDILGRHGEPPPWFRLRRSEEVRLHATAYSMGLLTDKVRSATVTTLQDGALYSLDASFIQDDDILAMFQPSELMHLTAGLLAKLDSEIAQKIAHLQAQADPNRDIDSQFEEVANFLDDIRFLVEADSVFDDKFKHLAWALERAKKEVEAEKSPEQEEDSFFSNVPVATQREQHGGRSVFSDVDE